MPLSLCLIARNEGSNLSRAVGSFSGICDQIVVVDTGSTDDTVSVARSLGAQVEHFAWCDDFSAARNFCLNHATGDWVFWLDADEELLPECRDELRACLNDPHAAGWFVLRQDVYDADRTDHFTEMWQLRLFRRLAGLRFRGRCHPDFHPPLHMQARQHGMLVKPSSIRLRHWGYLPQLKRAKLERSVRLLELELRDRPNQLYYQIELGRTLLALGRSAAAKSVLGGATAALLREAPSPHPPTSMAAALLEYLLAAPASESAAFIAESALLDLCQRWFPRSAPLLWAIARRAYAAGDFVHAAGALQKLIDLGRSDSYDKMISFDPRIIREDAVLNLAACHIRLARLDEAERLLRGLLVGPRAAEAEANLKAIGHLRGLAAE